MKIRKFKLSEQFLEPYKTKAVPWGPVGYVTYKRTYARRLNETEPGATGTEEWWQTCRRVIEGMFNLQKQHIVSTGLEWNDAKAQRTAKDAYERLFVLKWTPPGRGLWMMGTDFVENRTAAGLFNCAFRSTRELSTKGGYIFGWMMDALMLGIGVGFDTLGAETFTIQAPGSNATSVSIQGECHNTYYLKDDTWQCEIADSREGWIETVQVLLNAFYTGSALPVFDYSLIRGKGELIKGFGGTSSGYKPLEQLHKDLIDLYTPTIGELISSVTIVDTENLIGKCVVAGNVRRSAALAMGSPTDWNYLTMKNDQEKLRSHRWGSNNSFHATVGMDYTEHAKQSAIMGEPGYIWLDNARHHGRMKDPARDDDLMVMGFNPCVEQQLEDGELCCLTETFPAKHDSFEDFKQTQKIAYLYGKTVTLARTQWAETNAIMLKNRRIGLSMSGFVQAMQKHGRRNMFNWCDDLYAYIQDLDAVYSDWFCIPRSKRRTSIKPSGTVSKLNGSTAGIHYPEAEYYIQRIRFSMDSDMVPTIRAAGYHIEPCIYSPNTYSISFPIHAPLFVKSKSEVSMWEQMELAANLQYYWADNSVSVTVTFKPEEANQIKDALEFYETRLKAVSFLQYDDNGYEQAPWEAITKEVFETMSKDLKPILNFNTNEQGAGTKFCDGDSCEIDFSSFAQN